MASAALIILWAVVIAGVSSKPSQHGGPEWEYRSANKDHLNWGKHYPHCNEQKQSPVNIIRNQAVPKCFRRLQTDGYAVQPKNYKVANNGHSAQYNFAFSTIPSVSGGPLPQNEKYIFEQIHFHWGEPGNTKIGSEHRVDGKSYPLEMHMVHYNAKYGSFAAAARRDNDPKALMVLGVLFEISAQRSPHYQKLIDGLRYVIKPVTDKTTSPAPSFDLLLPRGWRDEYYTYSGSLTTPPCSQSVIWIVFKNTIPISVAQHDEFEKLQSSHGGPILDNFRTPQQLAGRKIEVNKCK